MKTSARLKSVRFFTIVGVGTVLITAGVGGALALNSNQSAKFDTVDSPSGIAGKSWADLGAEEFATLPIGSRIVDCLPTVKRYPPGVIPSQSPSFTALNPGRHLLLDGRCALDPSVVPIPMRVDNLDPPTTSAP